MKKNYLELEIETKLAILVIYSILTSSSILDYVTFNVKAAIFYGSTATKNKKVFWKVVLEIEVFAYIEFKRKWLYILSNTPNLNSSCRRRFSNEFQALNCLF